jgi:hypothetical protein
VGARKLVDGGEWIVKFTDSDGIAPGNITFVGACSVNCSSGAGGLDIRLGKKTDPNDIGDEAFCVNSSHSYFTEFAKLRNGDKVRFEYSETPLQQNCYDEAMFISPKRK